MGPRPAERLEHRYDHTLLLTNLDAELFSHDQCNRFLPELVVASLLHREVELLTVDLVTNKLLAEYFCANQQAWHIFEDLILNAGAIKLIRHRSEAYAHPSLDLDPIEHPVEAWAKVLQNKGLFGSELFCPTPTQQSFYKKVDAAFQRADAVKESPWIPSGSPFAIHLRGLLRSRRLWSIPAFSALNSDAAKRYIEFTSDDEAWTKALKSGGLFLPQLAEAKFARSAAYRCLGLFEISEAEKAAWKSLFQSAYYSDLCSRLNVAGRFGGRLFDLPLEIDEEFESAISAGGVIRVQVDAAPKVLSLAPGIGNAIGKAREALRINQEDILASLWNANDPGDFPKIWQTITTTVAASMPTAGPDFSLMQVVKLVLRLIVALETGHGAADIAIEGLSFFAVFPRLYRRWRLEEGIAQELNNLASVRAVGLPAPRASLPDSLAT